MTGSFRFYLADVLAYCRVVQVVHHLGHEIRVFSALGVQMLSQAKLFLLA